MTAAPAIVKDVANVFRFIEKPFLPVKFKELLVSPNTMKKNILAMIQTEIKNKKQGKEVYKVKINHITDEDVVRKLYDASTAGVEVDFARERELCVSDRNTREKRSYPYSRNHRPLSGT